MSDRPPPGGRSPAPATRGGDGVDTGDLASLLVRAGRGEDSAWRELIALYGRRVYAMARSRVRRDDLAEEIAQSVFATIAAKLSAGEYFEQGRFESWLFRITMNRVRDEARRRARQAEPTDPEVLGNLATVVDNSTSSQAAGTNAAADEKELGSLRDAMGRLTDADREVVELRHHGGLSFQQIAAALEEPLGTVLARHHRALRKLKDLIEGVKPSAAKKVPS